MGEYAMRKCSKLLCFLFSLILTVNMIVEPVLATDAVAPETTVQENDVEQDEQIPESEEAEDSEITDTEDSEAELPTDTENQESAFEGEIELPEAQTDTPQLAEEMIKDLQSEATEQGKVKISWTVAKEGFSGWYFVAVYSDKKMKNLVQNVVKITDASQTSYEFEGLEKDTPYFVKVIPYELQDRTEVAGKAVSTSAYIFGTTPVNLKATAGDAQVELKWDAVEGAEEYEVFCVNTNSVVDTTEDTSYVHTDLKNNATYTYKVRALIELGGTNCYSLWSAEVTSGQTKIVTPAAISSISISPVNKGAKITWSASEGATSYYVFRYSSSAESWVRIAHVTETTYKHTGLTVGKTYYYRVKAVRTSGGVTAESGYSDKVSITAKEYVEGAVHPMYYRGRITSRAAAYSTSSCKTRVGYLSAGTSVTILSQGKVLQVQTSNGKKYWISRSKVRFLTCIYTTKDYTTEDKLNFVNQKGYSSKTKYLIWISSYTQRVNIYQGSKGNWKLIRTCRIATGKHSTRTPRGTFAITYKEKGWYYTSTVVHKIVHFAGRNSFHSRIYYYNGRLNDATIGRPASHGCIRMYMEDITYIYNNMPRGTTVVSQ